MAMSRMNKNLCPHETYVLEGKTYNTKIYEYIIYKCQVKSDNEESIMQDKCIKYGESYMVIRE